MTRPGDGRGARAGCPLGAQASRLSPLATANNPWEHELALVATQTGRAKARG